LFRIGFKNNARIRTGRQSVFLKRFGTNIMKFAVTVRADDNIKSMTQLTFPIIEKFCKKCGAEFIVLDHTPLIMSDNNLPHFRIMKLYELLDTYDRIINLDADIVINKNCPNLFDVVPGICIGTIYEDKVSRENTRVSRIKDIQLLFVDIGWKSGYINTGVFVVSKKHREIFTSINGKYYTKNGSDDVHLGYQMKKLKVDVHELDYRFNHMTMFSENGLDRFRSFIIHYAGRGIFDTHIKSRNEQIQNDIKIIYG
jgi:lipopolysaccharide biosynthesis glycosyltransferase